MATKRITLKDIPTSQIDMIVGRFHVGTPDEEIAREIERLTDMPGWTPAARKLAIKYALDRHHKNARLATDIALGRIGRGRAGGMASGHERKIEIGDRVSFRDAKKRGLRRTGTVVRRGAYPTMFVVSPDSPFPLEGLIEVDARSGVEDVRVIGTGRGRASGKSRADAIVEIRHARYVEPGDTIGGSDGNAWRVLRFVGPNRAEVVLGNWDDVSDDESGGSTPRALVES